jgi:diadenosine tetraphosphate (Ap4A) HIT family hydrolase
MIREQFEPDIELVKNCIFIKNYDLCALYLSKNANFPWLILIPRRNNIIEIFDLSTEERKILIEEINEISILSKNYFSADKINIATFGNVVSQLHVHIIVRFKNDLSWPKTAWNCDQEPTIYKQEQIEKIIHNFCNLK